MKVNLNARVLNGLVQWIDEDRSGDLSVGDRVRVGNARLARVEERHLKDEYATMEFLSSAYLGASGSGRLSMVVPLDSDRRFLVYSDGDQIREVREMVSGKVLPFHEQVNFDAELAEMNANLDTAYASSCGRSTSDVDTLWKCSQIFMDDVIALHKSAEVYADAYRWFDAERQSLKEFYVKNPRANITYSEFGERADTLIAAQDAFRGRLESFKVKINPFQD